MQPDEAAHRRLRLIDRLLRLPDARLREVEECLNRLDGETMPQPEVTPPGLALVPRRDWPHAPLHRLSEQGTCIVTAGTHEKAHLFRGPERLDLLEDELLSRATQSDWQLEAWAVFSNHYHFIAHARPSSAPLPQFFKELHGSTSRRINELDGVADRQVWFNYWETRLTYERSYLARLNYVHQNPVKHGLVRVANQYRWCSAAWFERTAETAQVKTIYGFKIDKVKVEDDFEPV